METAVRLAYVVHDRGLVNEYDCDVCRLRGLDQRRACFRYHRVQPTNGIAADGSRYFPDKNRQRRRTLAEVWREVDWMESRWPTRDVLWHLTMLNVCPEGMVLPSTRRDYLLPEMQCETYGTAPTEGGIDAWPALVYDAFTVIRSTHQVVQNERQRDAIAKAKEK